MKKFFVLFITFFAIHSVTGFAFVPKRHLTLKVNYSNAKSHSTDPMTVEKTLKLDPCSTDNQVVMTQVKMIKDQPVSEVLLVKVKDVNKDQANFTFTMLSYGYKQDGKIISQPELYLKNGQSGEISNDDFDLKLLGNWS